MLTLLLTVSACGGFRQQNQGNTGGGCSVTEQEDKTVVIKCDDGSSQVIPPAKSCSINPDPNPSLGYWIHCPNTEPVLISNGKNGANGKDGTECTVNEAQSGQKYLECDGKIIYLEQASTP